MSRKLTRRVDRAMGAARKSFRGGPTRPTQALSPLWTPYASAVQAAEAVQPQVGVPGAASVSARALLAPHRQLFETAMVAEDVEVR